MQQNLMGSEKGVILWIWNWLPWRGIIHFIHGRKMTVSMKVERFRVSIRRQSGSPFLSQHAWSFVFPIDFSMWGFWKDVLGCDPRGEDFHRVHSVQGAFWMKTKENEGVCLIRAGNQRAERVFLLSRVGVPFLCFPKRRCLDSWCLGLLALIR